jgi:hypothetical protein
MGSSNTKRNIVLPYSGPFYHVECGLLSDQCSCPQTGAPPWFIHRMCARWTGNVQDLEYRQMAGLVEAIESGSKRVRGCGRLKRVGKKRGGCRHFGCIPYADAWLDLQIWVCLGMQTQAPVFSHCVGNREEAMVSREVNRAGPVL